MCEIDCPPTQYPSKDLCLDCPFTCLTCVSDKICTQCNVFAKLNSQYQCELICGSNEYSTGNSCVKCPTTCASCLDSNICTSCITEYSLYKGQCIPECPEGTVKKNNSCYLVVTCNLIWFW